MYVSTQFEAKWAVYIHGMSSVQGKMMAFLVAGRKKSAIGIVFDVQAFQEEKKDLLLVEHNKNGFSGGPEPALNKGS